MIFSLAQDFHDAVAAIRLCQGYGGQAPREHPKHRMLELLEEAIRRDIHFIARHPTTLFQCMWNTCWPVRRSRSGGRWYECPVPANENGVGNKGESTMKPATHRIMMAAVAGLTLFGASVPARAKEAPPRTIAVVVHDAASLKTAQKALNDPRYFAVTVTIKPNTYYLDDTFRINRSNVIVQAEEGAKLVLKAHVNRPVIAIGSQEAVPAATVENITLKGLVIDGNKDNQDSEYDASHAWIRNNCIDVRKARHVTIDGVSAANGRSGGLVISYDSAEIRVRDSSFNANHFDGIAYYASDSIFTTNCVMQANGSAAISLDNDLRDCIFSNCVADANGDVGIFARNSQELRFSNCVIRYSASFAVFLSHDAAGNGVHDIVFSNCHILNNVDGLKVASTEDKSSRVSVTGCVFHGNGGTPVATDGTVVSESANIVQP